MILKTAKQVLKIEAESILNLIDKINGSFVRAVDLISTCKGKVALTGIGKSGFIGKKIASTLASTGTPALFLHPAEGIHGDLGMLAAGDVVIALSNSGETEELIGLLETIKRLGIPLISMGGRPRSTHARNADGFL